jgi:hypothetical protein
MRLERRDVEAFGPVEPFLGVDPPRVRLRLHVLEDAGELAREARFLLHEVAAHVDDLVDVLDEHGARLLAGAANVAGPQRLVLDDRTDDVLADHRRLRAVAVGLRTDALGDHLVLVGVEIVAQVEQQLAGRERLAGRGGGTLRRTAAALGAAVHVQDLFPSELVDVRGPVARRVLQILLGERPGRLELLEEHVRGGGDDVEVLRAREKIQKRQDHEVVDPPGDVADRHRSGHSECGEEHATDEVRRGLPGRLAHHPGVVSMSDDAAAVVE